MAMRLARTYASIRISKTALMTTTALIAGAAAAQEAEVDLGELVISSALRDARPESGTPVTIDVVGPEELARKQPSDLGDLLEDVPGVLVTGGPRAIAQTANIRGFSDNQLVFRLDGGRLNFNQAHRGRSFFDPALIKQVEVIKGGGSTLYGSGALGGVIAVETVDAKDLLRDGQTMGARLSFGLESNGEKTYGAATVYADWGDVDALLSLSHRDTAALIENGAGGDTPFSTLEQLNGLLKLGFEPTEDTRFELSIASYDDRALTPANTSANPGGSNPVVDRDGSTRDFRLSYDWNPAGNDLIDLSVLIYDHRLDITELDIATADVDRTQYDTTGFEVVNRSRFDAGVPVSLVYGFEVFRDTQTGFANGAPRPQFPDAEARTIGVFAEGTLELSAATNLVLGARFDRYERDPNDPTLAVAEEDFFSPRIGLSHKFNDSWEVYSNLSRAFRAPTLTELYATGLHFPGNPFGFPPDNFFVPNPNLRPEKSTQFELGTRFENGPWSVDAAAFYSDVDDYIDTVVNVPAGTTSQRNVDAKLYGFEAKVGYDRGDLFWNAGLTIVRGKDKTADEFLGSLPQDRLTATLGYRPNADWTLGTRATFAASQNRVPPTGAASDSYTLVDVFATYAPDDRPLEVQFGVDNVFDEDYTVYPNALAQPGRNFKLTMSYTF